MAENYGTLEGTLDEHGVLSGEMSDRATLEGEIQFGSGGGGVLDVFQNGQSVVQGRYAYVTVPTFLSELRSDDYHNTVTTLEIQNWNGKADPSDIPTALSQLDNDANYVQDADYVHTENNFTDEDKAAIGNIPENITDLSDVAVDNIQNGQVLKWDATQEKFVNADESGGGGDVTDVKVDGTSVVDPVTGEADIDLTGKADKVLDAVAGEFAILLANGNVGNSGKSASDMASKAEMSVNTSGTQTTVQLKNGTSATINNPTITIQKNGQNVDTFSLNQTTNKVIDISVPTKTSDLQNDSSFITNTVNNLANYYLKTQTYTQAEVDALIDAAINGRFKKVTVLPVTGEPNIIYLVPKATPETSNACDEYIWQDNDWELIGSTNIDLSGYVTDDELTTALQDYLTTSAFNTAIANYYTKTEVGNLLDDKVDKVSGKGLSTYDYDATAKGIVDNVTTNLAGKVDKVNGKGLSTEDYTTTEKNKLAGISTGANKVESSTTNGNIRIDGTETQVYDGSGKVDKVNGKGLSTNDYDNTDKAKVDKIDITTTSISGNPILISGLKANQLAVNPIITLEPIQAGSGTPSPVNQRPISGYDRVEALSCGVNVWNEHTELGIYDSSTGLPATSQGNLRSKSTEPIVVEGNKTYYWKNTYNGVVFFYNSADNFISSTTIASGGNTTFTTPANTKYMRFHITANYGTTYNHDLSINYPATITTYVPYNKATSISESLGQTVYGLTHEVRTGKARVTIGAYLNLGDFDWLKQDATGVFYTRYHNELIAYTVSGDLGVKCTQYPTIDTTSGISALTNADYGIVASSSRFDTGKTIAIKDKDKTNMTAAEFKTAMNGVMMVYTLAEPFTIQLTPHEISLLKDYAYVSTNGTNIALDYHNGELASLADVSQLGETVNELGDSIPLHSITKLTNQSFSGMFLPATGASSFKLKITPLTGTNNSISGILFSRYNVVSFIITTNGSNKVNDTNLAVLNHAVSSANWSISTVSDGDYALLEENSIYEYAMIIGCSRNGRASFSIESIT